MNKLKGNQMRHAYVASYDYETHAETILCEDTYWSPTLSSFFDNCDLKPGCYVQGWYSDDYTTQKMGEKCWLHHGRTRMADLPPLPTSNATIAYTNSPNARYWSEASMRQYARLAVEQATKEKDEEIDVLSNKCKLLYSKWKQLKSPDENEPDKKEKL